MNASLNIVITKIVYGEKILLTCPTCDSETPRRLWNVPNAFLLKISRLSKPILNNIYILNGSIRVEKVYTFENVGILVNL